MGPTTTFSNPRAIAKTTKVIIADEPTASLDQATGLEVMRLFAELHSRDGVGSDLFQAMTQWSTVLQKRTLTLTDGRLEDECTEVKS